MAITATDILLRLSGGASNSSQAAALGGIMSTTTVASGSIFDDVSSAESAAGDIEYRCIYVLNNHGTLSLDNAIAWLTANTPSATTTVDIGVGSAALNATEQTVADENTAPTGITFVPAASVGAAIALGSIPAGQRRSIWIRRTVNAATSAVADSFTVRVTGDTAP